MNSDLVYFIYWFIKYYLPPMIANSSPLLIKGSKRIDRGKLFLDNKPLLGKNKTWEGFIIGVYMGSLTGLVLGLVYCDLLLFFIGFVGSLSALIGDLIGSFLKRRLGISSGKPLPVIDQLDFALASTLAYFLLGLREFYEELLFILYALLIILLLHIVTNNIAYYLGVKDTRW